MGDGSDDAAGGRWRSRLITAPEPVWICRPCARGSPIPRPEQGRRRGASAALSARTRRNSGWFFLARCGIGVLS